MLQKTQLDTKQLLANELFNLLNSKSFQKISVNELCERVMVSRSTFYLHFKDKYELLSFCLEKISQEMDAIMETHSPKDFLIVMLNNCQKNERILYHIFESELNEELLDMLYKFFSRYLLRSFEAKAVKGDLLPGPIDSVVAFYVGGLTNMTFRWIKSNCKLPKEILAACQYRLLKDII